jgi:hypothetical protein
MPPPPVQQDTFLRNLSLIISPWNVFVFLIYPAIAWFLTFWVLGRLEQHGEGLERFIDPETRITLAIVHLACVVSLGFFTSDRLQDELRERGYVRRRGAWQAAYAPAMAFAFCALFANGGKLLFRGIVFSQPWQGTVFIVFSVGVLWAAMLCGMLGPILILTVRTT